MKQIKLSSFIQLKKNFQVTPRQNIRIGIASVTIQGMLDCIHKMHTKWNGLFNGIHDHPHIIIQQPNFGIIHEALKTNQWSIVENTLVASISELEKSGADFVIIPANTVHKVINGIQERSKIPVINILTSVADVCKQHAFKRIGIMGTSFTIKEQIYLSPLNSRGIEQIIPDQTEQKIINNAIFNELIQHGSVSVETMNKLLSVVNNLKKNGCDAVALACTELPLVLNNKNCSLPTLDTTALLAQIAVNMAYKLWKEKIKLQKTDTFELTNFHEPSLIN